MSSAVATPTQPTMRTPEYDRSGPNRREGKTFENEYFQYLSPESFTVLPPEAGASPVAGGLPSPPKAPEPYKLTPRSKRHKQQSFAIIAETGGLSAPSSRAGSPTGRVSPFRGRGFNPTGSRHASPAPSPPPGDMSDDAILRQSKEMVNQLRKSSIGRSQIPVLLHRRDRRSSAEDILSPDPDTSPPEGSPTNLQLQSRYSQSMINIAPRNLSKKPPPSPRRSNLKPSFVRLSPIIGSSPEAGSDHMSSPSKIPKTRSQPPSRAQSPSRALSPSDRQRNVRTPTRTPSRTPARTPSRTPSRNPSRTPVRNSVSRPASRNGSTSREPSPGRSPSKIPMNKSAYKNIPAKVETFTRVSASSKPKVPQKPKVYSTRTNVDRSNSTRKTVNKSISSSRSPRKDLEDTETTDTEKEPIRNRRQSISNYNSVSRRNSISKPSTSGYKQSRKQQDGEKSSTSRNNKTTTTTSDSYDRSSTSTVVGKTTKGMGSRTSSQTFKRDDGAKENRSRRNDTTTATSTTEELSKTDDETTEDGKDDDILSVTIDEFMGSQTTKIVSATAETVVKPLNIEAKLVKQSEADEIANTTTIGSTGNKNSTSVHSSIKRNTSQANMNVNKPVEHSGPNNNKINNNGASKNITDSTTHTSNKPVNPENNTSDQSTKQSSNPAPNISSNPPSNNPSNPASNISSNPASNLPSNLSNPSSNPTNHSPPLNGALPTSQSNSSPPEQINNLKHMSSHNSLTPSIDMNVKNNLNNLTPPDSDKVSSKSLMDSSPLTNSARVKQRTVIVDEIKPIKITVREKSGDVEVQSGNYALPRSATNGIAERPHLPPSNNPVAGAPPDPPSESKPRPCSKLFSCCKKKPQEAASMSGSSSGVQVMPEAAHEGHEGDKPPSRWNMCCKGKGKVGDSSSGGKGCFPKLKKNKEENWAERRDSILSEPPKKTPFSQTLRKIFCSPCVKCKKKPDESVSRRTSMMSKKKSLSSTMQPPPEKKDKKKDNANNVVKDTGPKLEASLVEHASHMRGAIPVLPVPLAWICLICNVFLPGFGTILSGLLCLCIGIPRFSPRDSAKARFGAFLIDVIVGISQCFTVLFCLVGWGWSIWWGVIMLKVARKHRRIKLAEETAIEDIAVPTVNVNNRDVERGS